MLLAIHGGCAVLLVILGLVLLSGRGAFLIAGYNTASKEEKEKIDEKKLCKYVGKQMLLFAGCFLILMASDVLGKMWLLWLGLALLFGTVIGGVIYLNTGDRLKK